MTAMTDSAETILWNYLTAVPGVKALLAVDAAGVPAMWLGQAPQQTPFPRIIYGRSSADRGWTLDGGADGLPNVSFNFECQGNGSTPDADAQALADAVRDALDGRKAPTAAAAGIRGAFLRDERLEPYPAIHADEQGVKAIVLEFDVHIQERRPGT